jgi:tetratricopeptide (TPR) repeat protein
MSLRGQPLAGLLMLAAAGCGEGRGDDQRTGAVGAEELRLAREQLRPEVRAALDSGNAAFSRGALDEALVSYEAAVRVDPQAAAAWFGIYMVRAARGEAGPAQEALVRARAAAPASSLLEEKKDR